MPSSDVRRRAVALPGLLALALLAAPAHAFDPERDTWLLPDAADARQSAPRLLVDPIEYARIKATGNDLEPEYAGTAQLLLIRAVEQKDREQIETLLQQGVNPNGLTGPLGDSALAQAVRLGDVESVRLLLDAGADPDLKAAGYTPLVLAALRGHARIVALLLKAGADPDRKAGDGNTPLTAAAGMDRVDCLRALLAARPDITLFNREGRTALSIAAMEGFEEAVRVMLEAGVDPNVLDRSGGTALTSTSLGDTARIEKLLVSHGASTQ